MHPSRKKKKSRVILGESIRRLRTGKGWSQEELGEECSLHRTYIGGIERGERNVSIDNIEKIADSLGASITDLLKEA